MKRTKTQKGITLVALILTIVVLLILAVVAITAIQNTAILEHANNAANAYTQNQLAENTYLNEYENFLNNYASTGSGSGSTGDTITYTWTQSGTSVTNGTTTLAVGDSVTLQAGTETPVQYTEGNFTWKVLGAENGKLLLATTSSIGNLYLEGVEGYNTGVSQLNGMCDDYLNTTYADEARSIKKEDIGRVTGNVYVFSYDEVIEYPLISGWSNAWLATTSAEEYTYGGYEGTAYYFNRIYWDESINLCARVLLADPVGESGMSPESATEGVIAVVSIKSNVKVTKV